MPPIPVTWGKVLASQTLEARSAIRFAFPLGSVLILLGVAEFLLTLGVKGPLPCVGLVMAGVGLLLLGGALLNAIEGDRTVRFHEGGVQRVSKKKPLMLDYQELGGDRVRPGGRKFAGAAIGELVR